MTRDKFNTKYSNYIEEGFYGLEFDIPEVTEMLDKVFQDLILIPDFTYTQIKLKFGFPRVYTSLGYINDLIELKISQILAVK